MRSKSRGCQPARGLDADRRFNLLILNGWRGSKFHVESQAALGALILSTTGSLRDRIDGLDDQIERGNTELRGAIDKLQEGQAGIGERLARL